MIVTFCGHKDTIVTANLSEKLTSALEQLIGEGADQFYLGGYGAFDMLAAKTVKALKERYPQIRSTLVVPYLNQEYDKEIYDDTAYPPLEEVPRRFAISRRNEWMVDHADVVVAYVTHDWGGAASTLKYSERKKKRIINIATE